MLKAKAKKLMQAQAAADQAKKREENAVPKKPAPQASQEKKAAKPNPTDIVDEVDEAGWESFPASDPPSYTPETNPRGAHG